MIIESLGMFWFILGIWIGAFILRMFNKDHSLDFSIHTTFTGIFLWLAVGDITWL